MAHAVSRRPLAAEVRVRARVRPCEICGGQSGTGTAFSPNSSVSLPVSCHHGSPYSYIIWEMNNSPVGSRSSETSSHPIGMNNNSNKNNINNLIKTGVKTNLSMCGSAVC
jgi:hypothetical protein